MRFHFFPILKIYYICVHYIFCFSVMHFPALQPTQKYALHSNYLHVCCLYTHVCFCYSCCDSLKRFEAVKVAFFIGLQAIRYKIWGKSGVTAAVVSNRLSEAVHFFFVSLINQFLFQIVFSIFEFRQLFARFRL